MRGSGATQHACMHAWQYDKQAIHGAIRSSVPGNMASIIKLAHLQLWREKRGHKANAYLTYEVDVCGPQAGAHAVEKAP